MESGALNGVVGDSFGTDLPQTIVPPDELVEEKKKARFSKTKEFKEQKAYMESRVAYYQSFLPGNIPIVQLSEEERGKYWGVADLLIKEFRDFLSIYENANDVVNDAQR